MDKDILRKYFNNWHRRIKLEHENRALNQRKAEQRQKLDNLITTLKSTKKQPNEHKVLPVEIYKSRYNAQKDAIEQLTIKLEAKDRVINELKTGLLNEEALKSLENSKIEIREIFANCSTRTKLTKPPPPQCREFTISVNKAPKIVQEMEEKALKRAQNHQMILERKRIIEETRQRMSEIALEKKRIQDEEEKWRNLEIIKQKREQQLRRERIRQRNKAIFIEKWTKVANFHNRKLLKSSFKKLVLNYKNSKNNYDKSVEHYRRKLLVTGWNRFKDNVEDSYRDKYKLADGVYHRNILIKCLQVLSSLRFHNRRNMQVAEDYNDFRLQLNVFLAWHRYACKQLTEKDRKLEIAEKHYRMKLLFNFFYQWHSLPAILQLERAKELKKRKWRAKVWEILPDYQPPNLF